MAQSLWDEAEAQALGGDLLQLRVYSSRLLGQDAWLVLHGGGNTSVKMTVKNFFGEDESVLYIKASGGDMAILDAAGFTPLKLPILQKLAALESLSDVEMMRQLRAALLDPDAPTPSVEALLHTIIPFRFVDHIHADAVLALMNTPEGEAIIRQLYGERVLIIPYVMPGFDLAQEVYRLSRDLDWSQFDGLMLMNHGVFTFSDDAQQSYEKMITLVTQAETYLMEHGAMKIATAEAPQVDLLALSHLRRVVSESAGRAMIAQINTEPEAVGFTALPNVIDLATRGPVTPDHAIRTKRLPIILGDDFSADVGTYADDYRAYFERHATDARHASADLTMFDPAPRWAVWPMRGVVAFGENCERATITADIVKHSIPTIQWAEGFSHWQPLPETAIFAMEYWRLQQAKLKKVQNPPEFEGRVVLVTGAASGIGRAVAQAFIARGAAVVALDINPAIETLFNAPHAKGWVCDMTDTAAMQAAVDATVRQFGGLDILVSNAGIFPPSARIEEMNAETWERSLNINLSSHQRLMQACIPYLKNGVDPSILVIGSKNYPAPGPGASAYSVAKAGLTQLVRVAALELAQFGIRVNITHPDAVFDTGIWTPEVLAKRAQNYGLTVEAYKTKNLLHVEITSHDVAELICVMAGRAFSRTTGAQVPIDGGNDRVI